MQRFERIKLWILLALLSFILTVKSSPVSTNTTTVDGNAIIADDTGSNCERIIDLGFPRGIYSMDPAFLVKMGWMWGPFEIYCEKSVDVGWTVIQRREQFGQHLDFNRSADDYSKGFGHLTGDFWLGNQWIHQLTTQFGPYELRIELEDSHGQMAWAQYSKVHVYGDSYLIDIDGYTGNATDSMESHTPFLTNSYHNPNWLYPVPINYHRDLDESSCPVVLSKHSGGWWYNRQRCFDTNLNGNYIIDNDQTDEHYGGIVWKGFGGDRSLKSSKMMIRSKLYRSLNLRYCGSTESE